MPCDGLPMTGGWRPVIVQLGLRVEKDQTGQPCKVRVMRLDLLSVNIFFCVLGGALGDLCGN